ncbi:MULTISPECIES: hypothetical protein [unclassified Saccharopolyspora]|uniref:hypothetical protein n=2 Tax=Pseudonocardiaceae TaxID=2070 RepID=UPI00190D6647|nr:hypothetical protein [Saccharopolyspora sp. HNM0986]MBK0865591.1 hypothetical protein [Saccharopolyspora sp. HNM0986]
MKIRSTSVAVLAAVPLALAGCSQGPQPPEQPPQQPPAPQQQQPAPNQPAKVSAEGVAWTGKLCGLVGSFSASQQQAPQVDRSNTDAFKNSSVAQMTAAEQAANQTVTGLQQIGPSPIKGGDQVAGTFVDGFSQVRDILSTAKGKAEQVDSHDKQAFTAGMTGVQDELKKGQQLDFSAQFEQFSKNAELNQAATQAPECQQLTAQAQQQAQQQQQMQQQQQQQQQPAPQPPR